MVLKWRAKLSKTKILVLLTTTFVVAIANIICDRLRPPHQTKNTFCSNHTAKDIKLHNLIKSYFLDFFLFLAASLFASSTRL